jgi:hypothetical protein
MAAFGDRSIEAGVSYCMASWQVPMEAVRKLRRRLHLFVARTRNESGVFMEQDSFTQPGSKPACRPQGSAEMPDEVLSSPGIWTAQEFAAPTE